MTSLITMGSIYTWSDKSVAYIISGTQSRLCIRAIVWINIHCKIQVFPFSCFNKAGYYIIIVRTATVLCTNRNLMFLTGKSLADTAHVYG